MFSSKLVMSIRSVHTTPQLQRSMNGPLHHVLLDNLHFVKGLHDFVTAFYPVLR